MAQADQTKLIHETEWKNLILLDACKYQAFKDTYEKYLEGILVKARSPASCTRHWLRETWYKEDYSDITYISCNMFMQRQIKKHKWQYPSPEKFKRVIDVWKEGLMPEHIEPYALTVRGRKVLHYNFPHAPYYGKVKTEDYEGYVSNLEFILEHLVKLIPKLNGMTVITADHGELFVPLIYHPCSKDSPRLRDVPWFIVSGVKE